MYDLLIQTLQTVAPLDAAEIQFYKDIFQPLELKRGDFFLETGAHNDRLGFVVKGMVRYFVYKQEEEATLEFTREGEFVAEYQSLVQQTRSIQSIQAVEDTQMLVISNKDLQAVYHNTPHGNLIGRVVIEHRFNILMKQLMSIYMHNPDQRYFNFVETYPDLLSRIPQYYIASYVGVKPQSLSRIRRRYAQGIS